MTGRQIDRPTDRQTDTHIQQRLKALLMAVVGSPVDRREAVLVRGGGGTPALKQEFHHVHVAAGRGKVDGTATLVVPAEGKGEGACHL